MKGLITTLILVIAGLLAGCAPTNTQYYGGQPAADPGTTGFRNPRGLNYSSGGDPRIGIAIEEQRRAEANGEVPPPPPGEKPLRQRMIAFSIVRRNSTSTDVKRFGKATYEISAYVRNSAGGSYAEAKFAGKFGGTMEHLEIGPVVSSSEPNYTLTGWLEDRNDKVKGEFKLTNTKTKEWGTVIYRAFKTNINILTDKTSEAKAGNARFGHSIALLRTNTYGWVHNWVVPEGPSSSSTDILRVVYNDNVPELPILSFNVLTPATGGEPDLEHVAQMVKQNNDIESITMIGDAGTKGDRVVEVKLKDKATGEQTSILVEMTEDNPEIQPIEALPDITDKDDIVIAEPTPPVTNAPPPQPEPVNGDAPAGFRGVTERSFFKFDLSDPFALRMAKAYESNLTNEGVQRWLLTLTTQEGWRGHVSNFFYYAKPFAAMIEAIGSVYKSPASFTYLTLNEGDYFKGAVKKSKRTKGHGEYFVNGINAWGAGGVFQFKEDAAKESGLIVEGKKDDRMFFSTSACGAASYVRKRTEAVEGKDLTLGILGYTRGGGKLNTELRIASRLIKNYDYTYRKMAQFNAGITQDNEDYMDRFLSLYFIAGDPEAYGFSKGGLDSLPDKTVFPSWGIHSPLCREAVKMSGISQN